MFAYGPTGRIFGAQDAHKGCFSGNFPFASHPRQSIYYIAAHMLLYIGAKQDVKPALVVFCPAGLFSGDVILTYLANTAVKILRASAETNNLR
jgi:hypothetical protein